MVGVGVLTLDTTSGAINTLCFECRGMLNFTLIPPIPKHYFVGLYISLKSLVEEYFDDLVFAQKYTKTARVGIPFQAKILTC